MTTETARETARTLLSQWLLATDDTTGIDCEDRELIDTLAELIPGDPDVEVDWPAFDAAVEARRAEVLAEADEVRRSCQMTGRATIGVVTISPNTEFVCQTGSPGVRARQLAGWPTAASWYVNATYGGRMTRFDADDAGSWVELVAAVRDWERECREADGRAERERAEAAEATTTTAAADHELVAARRHLLGLSIDQLAGELNVNSRTARAWEQGQYRPGDWWAPAMAGLLAEHDADLAAYRATGRLASGRSRGWRRAVLARALDRDPAAR